MHVHTFTDATGFQRVTNSPHDCEHCREPYKYRPLARQARTVHYGGAQWRVSTYLAPRIRVDAVQGVTGYTGAAAFSFYRSDSFAL